MNRRAFLRGAAALPVAAVVPVVARPRIAFVHIKVGPWSAGSLDGPEIFLPGGTPPAWWVDGWSVSDVVELEERDPSVPVTGHLPGDDAGEEGAGDGRVRNSMLDTVRNSELKSELYADATGGDTTAGCAACPVQSEREGLHR